jgi:hypothetical protein
MSTEKRKGTRRKFSYYMRVMNDVSGRLVGHLTEISTGGFKIDSDTAIPPNVDFRLWIELPNDVASKNILMFSARSRWCTTSPIDPTSFTVGFQIVRIAPRDLELFIRLFEKYGSPENTPVKPSDDYLWK